MVLSKSIFVLAIILSSSVASAQLYIQECVPQAYTCDFYLCMESKFSCDVNGYFLSYGYRYCRKTMEAEETKDFSPEGYSWLEKTRQCLQERLLSESEGRDCKEIKKKSTEQHVDCYYQSGFCELSMKDKRKIYGSLASSLFKVNITVPAFGKMINRCGVKNALF